MYMEKNLLKEDVGTRVFEKDNFGKNRKIRTPKSTPLYPQLNFFKGLQERRV